MSTSSSSSLGAQARRLCHYVFGQSWARFGIVGVTATLVYYISGLGFERTGIPVLLGNAGAYVLGFMVSYFGHKLWSFQSASQHGRTLPRFFVTWCLGLGLNTLIIWLLIHYNVPYAIAMWVAIALVPIFTYFMNKFWVFRQHAVHTQEK